MWLCRLQNAAYLFRACVELIWDSKGNDAKQAVNYGG